MSLSSGTILKAAEAAEEWRAGACFVPAQETMEIEVARSPIAIHLLVMVKLQAIRESWQVQLWPPPLLDFFLAKICTEGIRGSQIVLFFRQ
jgi:hypothetical protein